MAFKGRFTNGTMMPHWQEESIPSNGADAPTVPCPDVAAARDSFGALGLLNNVECRMRKIFRFSFKRESYWLVVLYVVLPLLAILLLIVIPGLLRRWFP